MYDVTSIREYYRLATRSVSTNNNRKRGRVTLETVSEQYRITVNSGQLQTEQVTTKVITRKLIRRKGGDKT